MEHRMIITIYCTRQERRFIESAAKSAKLSMSHWIRRELLAKVRGGKLKNISQSGAD
jgi:mobilization protein NikA